MSCYKLRTDGDAMYQGIVGVGGIGSGILFVLEGNRDLRRNESRQARLLEARDYCKLHIVTHYMARLLGARPGGSFQVLPIGKVGNDNSGKRLLNEMIGCGLDTRFVETIADAPTLFSVCYQFPDGTGGNITTYDSAASQLNNSDIDRAVTLLSDHAKPFIALAVPEVPLDRRHHLLEIASTSRAFRVASFTSAEIPEVLRRDTFRFVDLIALNEDEAETLIGEPFDPGNAKPFLDQCAAIITNIQPNINIVVSAGKHGAFGFANGQWIPSPALTVEVISTMGAGDALLAGILAALTVGIAFIRDPAPPPTDVGRVLTSALDFGVLLASYSTTSSHTIHPDADLGALLGFADEVGVTFHHALSQAFVKA